MPHFHVPVCRKSGCRTRNSLRKVNVGRCRRMRAVCGGILCGGFETPPAARPTVFLRQTPRSSCLGSPAAHSPCCAFDSPRRADYSSVCPRLGEGRGSPARRGELGARGDPAAPLFLSCRDRFRRGLSGEKTMHGPAYRSARPRAAFTLIEALVSISITAIAGSVLLSGIGGSVQTASDALSQTVALGMAQQLMDEAIGNRYSEPGVADPAALPLGPDGTEHNAGSRKLYDDTDDYNTLRSQPPTDLLGNRTGQGRRHGNCASSQLLGPDRAVRQRTGRRHLLPRLAARGRRLLCQRVEPDDPAAQRNGQRLSRDRSPHPSRRARRKPGIGQSAPSGCLCLTVALEV